MTWSWKVQRGGVHDDGRGRPQVRQEGARRILINNFCKQVSWSKLFLKKNFHSQLCNNGAITHFVFQSDKACKNLICEFWKVDRKEKVAQADSILAISFITFRLLLWFDHDYNHDHYYNDNHYNYLVMSAVRAVLHSCNVLAENKLTFNSKLFKL